jgi:hypothetical protein
MRIEMHYRVGILCFEKVGRIFGAEAILWKESLHQIKMDCGRKFDAVCVELGAGLKKRERFRVRVLAGQRSCLKYQNSWIKMQQDISI